VLELVLASAFAAVRPEESCFFQAMNILADVFVIPVQALVSGSDRITHALNLTHSAFCAEYQSRDYLVGGSRIDGFRCFCNHLVLDHGRGQCTHQLSVG
jgi:hypothetical protein